MTPSAAQYKTLMKKILNGESQEDPTKVMMSCLITCAETTERLEQAVLFLSTAKVAPSAEFTSPAAPAAEEMEDLPPLRADVTAAAPAAQPTGAVTSQQVTTPVTNTPLVQVSTPQPNGGGKPSAPSVRA